MYFLLIISKNSYILNQNQIKKVLLFQVSKPKYLQKYQKILTKFKSSFCSYIKYKLYNLKFLKYGKKQMGS